MASTALPGALPNTPRTAASPRLPPGTTETMSPRGCWYRFCAAPGRARSPGSRPRPRTESSVRCCPGGASEIDRWLEEQRIDWRDDSSNLDTDFACETASGTKCCRRSRAMIRSSGITSSTSRPPSPTRRRSWPPSSIDAPAFIDPWDPDGGVETSTLSELPRALRARWLHGQMLRLGVQRTTRRQLELFHRCLDTGSPRSVTMGGRWRLRAARNRIWAEPPAEPPGAETTLEPGGSVSLGIPGWLVRMSTPESLHPGARWRWRPAFGRGRRQPASEAPGRPVDRGLGCFA